MIENLEKYSGLFSDSRKVVAGSVFFCVPAKLETALRYVSQAIEKGARLIVVDEASEVTEASVPVLRVKNIHKAMSDAAGDFYKKQPKHIAAVTGTNGKTSTVAFMAQMLRILGRKAATIGTLGVSADGSYEETDNTTPGAIDMARYMESFVNQGIDYAVFEASSHALVQHRVDGINIKAAGFTNLTQDHLDYHKDMKGYFEAKKRLFFELLEKDGTAVLNADDESFEELAKCGRKVISYGWQGKDIKILDVKLQGADQKLKLKVFDKEAEVLLPVSGDFQVLNACCALGMVCALGMEADEAVPVLAELKSPAGRLDFVGEYKGALVYVDYAHTPDALQKAIISLRPYVKNSLRVLFGCGGDRDATKRPVMGKIAADLAEAVYVTDDNPRTEDPAKIRQEVLQGCSGRCIDAGSREAAIKLAMSELEEGDVLLLAGKGHENYQVIGHEKIHFDDKEAVREFMDSF